MNFIRPFRTNSRMVVFRWSATPIKMGGSQESWSTPPHHHRSSLNSNYRLVFYITSFEIGWKDVADFFLKNI